MKMFLFPLMNSKKFSFCEWNPQGKSLNQVLPGLYDAVRHREEWRALIVCDDGGLQSKNPYERAFYTPPRRKDFASEEEYLAEVRTRKFAAFGEAAKQPLVRLTAWLTDRPTVTKGKNNWLHRDPEYAEYRAELEEKERLLSELTQGEALRVTKPCEIVCIARRCFTEEEYDLQTSWNEHTEQEYSRFYDWNLYADKLRYLVFDILPVEHKNYEFDYLRFLYVLLLLAGNRIPSDAFRAQRVYRVDCENDEKALARMLGRYEKKLKLTSQEIAQRIAQIKAEHRRPLSNREVESRYLTETTIPLVLDSEFDVEGLYVHHDQLGLSRDCPQEEYAYWDGQYRSSRKNLTRFLKEPRRSLKRAVGEMRNLCGVDSDEVFALSEFQQEDIEEYALQEEKKMVEARTSSLYDTARYEKELGDADREVKRMVSTRMTRRITLAAGGLSLLVYLIGFIPLISSTMNTAMSTAVAIGLTAGAVGALALISIGCLLVLRRRLRNRFKHYNYVMSGIVAEVRDSMNRYSRYLSHACTCMRCFSVLNLLHESEDSRYYRCRVLDNHRGDIAQVQAAGSSLFRKFVREDEQDNDDVKPYPYDFTRIARYEYPMPLTEQNHRRVPFLQDGNLMEIPVDFIERVTLTREELYD